MKFPLIEQMLLPVIQKDGGFYVSATYLEEIFQKATVVYGKTEAIPGDVQWSEDLLPGDTHSGRIILTAPIRKQTREEKALEFLKFLVEDDGLRFQADINKAKSILEET